MDTMKKYKLTIFGAFTTILVMVSCVKNDMDNCPATAVCSLVYEYTLNSDSVDRFTNLDRLYIYVFDKTTKECILMDTETGPFSSDYRYYLRLFPGEYDIITWGYDWPDNDPSQKTTTVVPDIVVGILGTAGTGTKIDEARLILEKLKTNGKDGSYNIVNDNIENTFYGESHVKIEYLQDSQTDTVSLLNMTNQIRIIFEDMNTAELQKNISVKIVDKNGAYYFYNQELMYGIECNPTFDIAYDKIEYIPFAVYQTDSILNMDPIVTRNIGGMGTDSILVTDFSVLRLFKNNDPFASNFLDAYLVIEWVDEDGTSYGINGDNPGITISLTDALGAGLQKMGLAYNQENLDRINRWEIKLRLQDTYVTGTINVLGWLVQVKNVTGGLLPY